MRLLFSRGNLYNLVVIYQKKTILEYTYKYIKYLLGDREGKEKW
jgi:hypothetical protein